MRIYALGRVESNLAVALENESLGILLLKEGISPNYVRACILDNTDEEINFYLYLDENGSLTKSIVIPDLLFWSWIPIFSLLARDVAISTGVLEAEFLPCTVGKDRSRAYMHLPQEALNIVDFNSSIFQVVIPVDPPIFHHIVKIALSQEVSFLPGCFRVPAPKRDQVSGDFFVTGEFYDKWHEENLVGATFRLL